MCIWRLILCSWRHSTILFVGTTYRPRGRFHPGNTVSYTLTDNGSLDLDPDDGELRDPVAVAIVGGSGIYVPFIPVPIPYWVLALLSGLMGWLGYRRLRLA